MRGGFVAALTAGVLATCASGCALPRGCADGPAVLDVRLSAPFTVLNSDLTSVKLCLEGGWCRTRAVPLQPGDPEPASARYLLSFTGARTARVAGPGSAWPKVALIVVAYSGSYRVVSASAWGSASPVACQHGNGGLRSVYRVKAWLDRNGIFLAYLPPVPIEPPGVD